MKVILFRTNWRSFFSIVISVVTRENYSHGALLFKGKLYDASEKRQSGAGFGGYLADYGSRLCDVFDVDEPLYYETFGDGQYLTFDRAVHDYINRTKGIAYDWKGVFGWLFDKQNPKKLYCYEYVCEALSSLGYKTDHVDRNRASHIKSILNEKPIYTGAADEYYAWRDNETD